MFKVNSNQVFIMNRGDDAFIPLFLNIGSRFEPKRYSFEKNDGCEIYFYILPINGTYSRFLLKKTFSTSGEIITELQSELPVTTQVETNINKNKDIVINITQSDLSNMCPGEYRYVIRAKILKSKLQNSNLLPQTETENVDDAYITVQVTNKFPFYLIDDDVNLAW